MGGVNVFLTFHPHNGGCKPLPGGPLQRAGHQGFTLIELSIVLVIIGLIVGGVLVGQDLIKASQVRATISQIEKFQTATMAFRDKYSCLPGDCQNATSFGLGTVGGSGDNGNGDQIYQSIWQCGAGCLDGESEIFNFFYHLSMAQMVNGSYASWASGLGNSNPAVYFPASPVSNNVYVFVQTSSLSAGTGYVGSEFGTNFLLSSLAPRSTWGLDVGSAIPVKLAQRIDAKIDDGWPGTGNVRVLSGRNVVAASGLEPPCTPNSGVAPFPYDINGVYSSNPLCTLAIKANF